MVGEGIRDTAELFCGGITTVAGVGVGIGFGEGEVVPTVGCWVWLDRGDGIGVTDGVGTLASGSATGVRVGITVVSLFRAAAKNGRGGTNGVRRSVDGDGRCFALTGVGAIDASVGAGVGARTAEVVGGVGCTAGAEDGDGAGGLAGDGGNTTVGAVRYR